MPISQPTSRYAYYDQPGPARDVIKLGTRGIPSPGPGAVLVRVHMSGVNPSDTKRRAGWASYKPRLPRTVLHCDGAGEIVAVGDGVPAARIGERVWLWNAESDGEGAAADHCVISFGAGAALPDNAGFDVGACLGVPACTAHRAVFADGPVDGQTILVHGAAGSVARLCDPVRGPRRSARPGDGIDACKAAVRARSGRRAGVRLPRPRGRGADPCRDRRSRRGADRGSRSRPEPRARPRGCRPSTEPSHPIRRRGFRSSSSRTTRQPRRA